MSLDSSESEVLLASSKPEASEDAPENGKLLNSAKKKGRAVDKSPVGAMFCYYTQADAARAKAYGFDKPVQVLEAGENDKLNMAQLESIKLCWSHARMGVPQEFIAAAFTAKDTVLTRKQLACTPILTRSAADRIIDFSPDLLIRDVLLRVCSEAGYSNTDLRKRLCLNGCYIDKATIAKRISLALGKKQTLAALEHGYDQYEVNCKDYNDYIEFFGKRATIRNMNSIKRPESSIAGSSGLDEEYSAGHKRSKLSNEDHPSSSTGLDGAADEDEQQMDEDDDSEAVSIQGSDLLDWISD